MCDKRVPQRESVLIEATISERRRFLVDIDYRRLVTRYGRASAIEQVDRYVDSLTVRCTIIRNSLKSYKRDF